MLFCAGACEETSPPHSSTHDRTRWPLRATWPSTVTCQCYPGLEKGRRQHIVTGSGHPVLVNTDMSKRLFSNRLKDNDHTAYSSRRQRFNNVHVGGQHRMSWHQLMLLVPSQPLPQSHMAILASSWLTRETNSTKTQCRGRHGLLSCHKDFWVVTGIKRIPFTVLSYSLCILTTKGLYRKG